MPRDLDVAFLAIDEVQLGADLERGHVFTDRMLNRRGREETLVLGGADRAADGRAAAARRACPDAAAAVAALLRRREEDHAASAPLARSSRSRRRRSIPSRELIRRQRGGAAVVLGALSRARATRRSRSISPATSNIWSPPTRSAWASISTSITSPSLPTAKFDGYQFRKLNPAELAQIAGRAGRATRDGTFGTTGRCPPFETELAQALESHSFEPIKVLQWRNTALDFSSVGALQASLAETPKQNGPHPRAARRGYLGAGARGAGRRHPLARDDAPGASSGCGTSARCPTIAKSRPATHAELATTLYGFLMREGTIPVDWFARQVEQADHAEGDIDTLSNRIAHIRTWTFAANRPDWLADPEHWQGVTRAVEDKLSDALHERLTERFVDRRTSVLMRRLRENTVLETDISKSGEVVVEGHAIGRLDGFMFTPAASAAGSEAKALAGAAQKALAGEIDSSRDASRASGGRAVRAGQRRHRSDGLASRSANSLPRRKPSNRACASSPMSTSPALRAMACRRGSICGSSLTSRDCWSRCFALAAAEDITGIARGVAFQLMEALGVLERQKVAEEVKGLDQPARATLRKYGVRFGAYHIYLPALLKPAPRVLATQLWALKHGGTEIKGLEAIEQLAASGRTSIAADKEIVQAALPHRRLSRLRRARGAGRHFGAACRPHSSRARMARWRGRREAAGRNRRLRLHRHRGHDVACRLLGRGFCLGAALARLSHGTAAEAGRAGARPQAMAQPAKRRIAGNARDRCVRA